MPASQQANAAFDPAQFLALVSQDIRQRSGSVFYSGPAAFSRPSPLYILGLNPGGSPIVQADETIQHDMDSFFESGAAWSRYADESWQGQPPGTFGMQPRVLHLLRGLELDPRMVPASNVVFVRTTNEATLNAEKRSLLGACWPLHHAVIEQLSVRTVLCFGGTAGGWVREALGAHEPVDSFVEGNARRWRSSAHLNEAGLCVITATHPSRANWENPLADPTPLVERMLLRS